MRQRPGLSTGHFRKIAVNGFGDPHNSYAWGSTWFNGAVYVGTNRDLLCMISMFPYTLPFEVWPVPLPPTRWDLDLRGQVWRYRPEADEWQRVYIAPIVEGVGGRRVPQAFGFRNMTAFQGKRDSAPAIYSIPSCGSYGLGPVLLRCADGVHFEQVGPPGLGLEDTSITSFRGVIPFKGRLYITPAGSRHGLCNVAYNVVVLCSEDPESGWEFSNAPAFGDPNNHTIFELGVCGDHLYAGTLNVREGCQLWKTDGEGRPPHRWSKVADRGFDRGPLNQMIMSFADKDGVLYLGTGIQNGGFDRLNNVGPAPAEVVRVHLDGTWDLVVGTPRHTRQGLKVPISGLDPGFGNPFAGYIWRMCAHEGSIYAGTFDGASLLPFSDRTRWQDSVRRILDPKTVETYMELRAGADLWRSDDGEQWVPITRNGFGNPYNYGIRSLISTPIGLVVGTANPYGPQVARRDARGWHYEPNPQGGLEVWLGSERHTGGVGSQGGTAGPEGAPLWTLPDGGTPEPPPEEGAFVVHSAGRAETAFQEADVSDALVDLARLESRPGARFQSLELELEAFYGGPGRRGVGYWASPAISARRACDDLIRQLIILHTAPNLSKVLPTGGRRLRQDGTAAPMPESFDVGDVHQRAAPADVLVVDRRPGAVLDVLRAAWPDARLSALAPAGEARLDRASRPVLNGAELGDWDAAEGAFDLVVWVDGPLAPGTAGGPEKALRALRPGGVLICTDLVGAPWDGSGPPPAHLPDAGLPAERYDRELRAAGFVETSLFDITSKGWNRFFQHSRTYFETKCLLHELEAAVRDEIYRLLPGSGTVVEAHLMASAVRPPDT